MAHHTIYALVLSLSAMQNAFRMSSQVKNLNKYVFLDRQFAMPTPMLLMMRKMFLMMRKNTEQGEWAVTPD